MSVRAVLGCALVEVRVRPRSRPGWKIAAGGLVIGIHPSSFANSSPHISLRERPGRAGTRYGLGTSRTEGAAVSERVGRRYIGAVPS